ncbi:MAG: hypothetical protein GY847_22655 [Proteobacteria bacterium]|nr:hypothetical protein [Pseudomonadota bacterium]
MQRPGLIPKLWEFLRTYLVAIVLISTLTLALFEVYISGTGPVPQMPPEGYQLGQAQVTLRWNRGTREGDIQLQVSMDDANFGKPMLDKKATGKSHSMRDLEPGHIYYWRLVQGNKTSPVAAFKTSPYAIKF